MDLHQNISRLTPAMGFIHPKDDCFSSSRDLYMNVNEINHNHLPARNQLGTEVNLLPTRNLLCII